MLISNLSLDTTNKVVIVAADVAFKGSKSERMQFSTNSRNASLISSSYAPFLAAVLLPCMKTGEDITIKGIVSKKLLANAEKIMDLVIGWNVGFKRIKIDTSSKSVNHNTGRFNKADKTEIGSFFSGGVDSFYTYLKHKSTKDSITNLILVHGFDIPLSSKNLYMKTKKTVEKIAKEEKINSIFVETNAGEIVEKKLIWDFAHGGALAAVGLFLSNGLAKVFIPAGLQKNDLFPYGTHPELDKLWSTETVSFSHDGTEYDRLGKIINSISKSPLALKYLRVCSQNLKGKYNCSRCYKCLQTMIGLVCAGTLQNARTFGKLDIREVSNMYYDYASRYNLQGEASLSVLRGQKREFELQKAIKKSLEDSKKPQFKRKLFQAVASLDQRFINRKLYRYVFRLNDKQDRNLLFKTLGKLGVLK